METTEEQKKIIERFLQNCNGYAHEKLVKLNSQLISTSDSMEKLIVQEKICRWMTYIAFNEYTLGELETGILDSFLGT